LLQRLKQPTEKFRTA